MLRVASPIVAECLAAAAQARANAKTAADPNDQQAWHALEAAWMGLAESRAFATRVADFLDAGTAAIVAAYPIAIVDDDPLVRSALRDLVRSCGFDARDYDSAREFLESLSSGRPQCLVLDVNMPEMPGPELHAKLARTGASIPTILITANYSEPDRARALAAGAVEYLRKPTDADTLLAAIRRVIGRH